MLFITLACIPCSQPAGVFSGCAIVLAVPFQAGSTAVRSDFKDDLLAAGLAALLSKEFLKWVLVANAIALPAAYVIVGRFWLANFAFRMKPGILIFIAVAGLSLVIALLTVSGQAIRAAVANPVDSLRYE